MIWKHFGTATLRMTVPRMSPNVTICSVLHLREKMAIVSSGHAEPTGIAHLLGMNVAKEVYQEHAMPGILVNMTQF